MSTEEAPTIAAVAQRDLGRQPAKSLEALADELEAGERATAMLKCRLAGEVTDGLLTLTDRRLVFVKRGVVRQHAITFPLDTIRGVTVGGRNPRKVHLELADDATSFDTETAADAAQTFASAVTAVTAEQTPSRAVADELVVLADVAGAEWMSVAGESEHQVDIDLVFDDDLVDLDGPRPSWAVILRGSDEDEDPIPVRVLISGSPVGRLTREDAERFAPFFDLYPAAVCPAMIRGPRGYRGVALRVDYRTLEDPDLAEVIAVPTLLWG